MQIRAISPDDHAAWLPLWQAYLSFYKHELPAQTSAVTWQRFLDPAEPMHAALAWQDGKAVGQGSVAVSARAALSREISPG